MPKYLRWAATLLVLIVAPLPAQSSAQVREGFTASIGIGAGSAKVTCDFCGPGQQTGPSAYLRLGGAYRPNLILAWEFNGWSRTILDGSDRLSLSSATSTLLVQWYPRAASGFFLAGGLGGGRTIIDAVSPDPAERHMDDSFGLGYQVGTGYDVRVRPNFSITPFATYFSTSGTEFRASGLRLNGNVVHAGLGATWH